jgi:tetratricopeptide (TPR) repeat protein
MIAHMTQHWRKQVEEWMKERRLEEAKERLLELAKERPEDAHVLIYAAWVHDSLGLEKEAVPYYEKALELGLEGDDLRDALLGLGSTYRCLGMYEQAVRTLRTGVSQFPDYRAMKVFLGMALYNVGQHRESTELLLSQLIETTNDPTINRYRKALSFYATRLDETWGDAP